MIRRPLPGFLIVSMALALGSVYFVRSAPQDTDSGRDDRAFLNTRWGMTPEETEKAAGAALLPVEGDERFYSAPVSDAARYRSYEQRDGVRFLGRPARATYTFLDGRLSTYHIFLSDEDGERLDADMRKYLSRRFGELSSVSEEEGPLKLVWQSSDRIVNYWFMEDEFSLRPKYTAGYGVTILKR